MNVKERLSDFVLRISIWLTKQRMDLKINGYKGYLWRRRGYIGNFARIIGFVLIILTASNIYNNPDLITSEMKNFNNIYAVLLVLFGYNFLASKFIARSKLFNMIQDNYMELDTRIKELNKKIDD